MSAALNSDTGAPTAPTAWSACKVSLLAVPPSSSSSSGSSKAPSESAPSSSSSTPLLKQWKKGPGNEYFGYCGYAKFLYDLYGIETREPNESNREDVPFTQQWVALQARLKDKDLVRHALDSLVRKHTGESWIPVRNSKGYLNVCSAKKEGRPKTTRFLLEEELDFCAAHGIFAKGSIAEFLLKQPFTLKGWPYGKAMFGKVKGDVDPRTEFSQLKEPFHIGENAGWSYLEVTYRLRMLWAGLYHTALRMFFCQTEKTRSERGAAESSDFDIYAGGRQVDNGNYLSVYFDTIAKDLLDYNQTKDQRSLLDSVFPSEIRQMLCHNQDMIQGLHQRGRRNPVGKGDITNPEHFLHLAMPWYQGIPGGQSGPVGPVSIEVAFILALQYSNIDLCELVATAMTTKPSAGQVEPSIYTGMKVVQDITLPGLNSSAKLPSLPSGVLSSGSPGFLAYESGGELCHHTTVFTTKSDAKNPPDSGVLGLYTYIDLFELADKINATNSDIFGFVIHLTDIETAQAEWTDGEIDRIQTKQYTEAMYWLLNGNKFPSTTQTYYDPPSSSSSSSSSPSSNADDLLASTGIVDVLAKEQIRLCGSSTEFVRRTEDVIKDGKGNVYSLFRGRQVHAHCHAVAWSKEDFHRACRDLQKDPEAGSYRGGYTHMYLNSEVDRFRYPRANRSWAWLQESDQRDTPEEKKPSASSAASSKPNPSGK